MMKCFLCGALLLVGASSIRLQPVRGSAAPSYGHPDWLNDCESIYLDVGTNIGVQLRKLFEPQKYPKAQVLPVFDEKFGEAANRPQKVCALGMEPNPHHQPRLQALEKAYNERGFRTHIYPFAAWKEEGTLDFRTDMKDTSRKTDRQNSEHEEWGGHINMASEIEQVRSIDLAAFIKSLPQGKIKLMKMDIEGAEYETLAHAIPQSVMCQNTIPEIYMETHGWGKIDTWKDERTITAVNQHIQEHQCEGSNTTAILDLDDESFVHDVDNKFSG